MAIDLSFRRKLPSKSVHILYQAKIPYELKFTPHRGTHDQTNLTHSSHRPLRRAVWITATARLSVYSPTDSESIRYNPIEIAAHTTNNMAQQVVST